MDCNFTQHIQEMNNICGNDIEIVRDECNIICMTQIMVVINSCLDFLKLINIDVELENIIKWCYFQKVESGEYLGNGH